MRYIQLVPQMMKPSLTYKEIHPKFKLNGTRYTVTELKEVAYSFVKEGEPHEREMGKFITDWFDARTTVEVQTSGSTGNPKKLELKKRHMANSALATGEFFGLVPETSALLCLPTNYIAGKMLLVRAMILGWELDYVEPSSRPLENSSRTYDFSAMVPLQLENSLDKIELIKTLIVGGAALGDALKKKLQDKSTQVFETYGMTETITHVALRKVNHLDDVNSSAVENHFRALPNIVFSKDQRDCLTIEAPMVADAPIVTNDVINLISKTEFEWLGRYDTIINSGGVKLIPEQIEKKLKAALDVPFFLAGVPDDTLSERLILVVEGSIDENQALDTISSLQTLSKYEIPKQMYQVPSFTYTETGKINRLKSLELAFK